MAIEDRKVPSLAVASPGPFVAPQWQCLLNKICRKKNLNIEQVGTRKELFFRLFHGATKRVDVPPSPPVRDRSTVGTVR